MNREALKSVLTRDEGKSSKAYQDTVGKWTIGVGRNISDVGLSESEIQYLLDNDISRCERDLDAKILYWRKLSETRQMVMICMCFNLGISGLLAFGKMLAAIQNSDYQTAAAEMLNSKWSAQVGARAQRLAQMMRDG